MICHNFFSAFRTSLLIFISILFMPALSSGPTFAGVPHIIYGEYHRNDGGVPADGDLSFEAWRTGVPLEILTDHDTGCGCIDGLCWVEIGNMPSEWAVNEILRVAFYDAGLGQTYTVDIELSDTGFRHLIFSDLPEVTDDSDDGSDNDGGDGGDGGGGGGGGGGCFLQSISR